jgi:hypothetical protein
MATWVMYVITHGANGNVGYNNRLVIAQFTQLKLTSKTRYYYWMLDKIFFVLYKEFTVPTYQYLTRQLFFEQHFGQQNILCATVREMSTSRV